MKNVLLDAQLSDHDASLCALFGGDGVLYLHNRQTNASAPLATPDNIKNLKNPIKLYYHHPYVCVTERFGLNAAVVDVRNGAVRTFAREDYHANVSSYSIGFLERGGRTLLIHQTRWNRLDITDLETGELLTPRDVYRKEIAPQQYDEANYLDYFHSVLHVAPDSKNFLSNGWVWHPVAIIRCFNTDTFLSHYEPSSIATEYGNGYNWDRPCAFIGNDTFVIATDDETAELDETERAAYTYHQLWFFRLTDMPSGNAHDYRWLPCHKKITSDIFSADKYAEVKGALHYDAAHNCLVALSEKGAFAVTPEGRVIGSAPELTHDANIRHTDFGSHYATAGCGWYYSTTHHLFYKYDNSSQRLVTKPLGEILAH